MNGNLSFNVLPNGQQTVQTMGYGLPQQAVQYVCGTGFQFQNNIQGIDFCLPNQQQLVPSTGQTYACINQNGMTYLAITPSIQQPSPQCYQAIETPNGLQLFQVINNPVNFGPVCVQNGPQAQSFFPQFTPYTQEAVGLQSNSIPVNDQHMYQPPNQEYQSNLETETIDQVSNEEETEETGNEDISDETKNLEDEFTSDEKEPEVNQNIQAVEDPLTALSSLTSSIPSSRDVSNSNVFDAYKNLSSSFSSNIPVPSLSNSLESQQVLSNGVLGLPDQQFPPNTRAFQVLVPTPQGMAIQTVVASYPESFSPLFNDQVVGGNNDLANPRTSLNPELVTPMPQSPTNATLASEHSKATTAHTAGLLKDSIPTPPCTIQAKPITSPCHSTTISNQQSCSELGNVPSPIPKASVSSIPAPLPSPLCLPDSTEDLCQPTIKQSTSNIVDGIDLEDIREFARTFKMRRLVLGLTQTQVGQALCATEGPAYSQSAICRFEKLDITPRSALKIRPVLENWLREAEEKHQQGNLQKVAGMDYVNMSAIGKIRKRRTFFSPEALIILNNRFEDSSHPSGHEISNIAQQIGYERDVVRVWFCNKRQSLRCQAFQRGRINLKSSDSTRLDRRSASPTLK